MRINRSENHQWLGGAVRTAVLGSAALMLTACIGSDDQHRFSSEEQPLTVEQLATTGQTPRQIAQTSAADYDENVNGLITGNTLKRWIDDWENNRPDGVTGKLVILQANPGTPGYEFIKPDNENVFTYHATEWTETRSNGVIETGTMVPSGATMDAFLAKYDINPTEDMIVCAPGGHTDFNSIPSQVMRSGRCWYMFRYWGTPQENLAQLNGDNQWNGEGDNTALTVDDFSDTASSPPGTGTASVKDLPEINFALQATAEDMMNVVTALDFNNLTNGIFIWDARGANEYWPGSDADFRGGATQGHPNGTLDLNYIFLLNRDQGHTFKSKAQIQAYMDGEVDENGNGFLDGTLQPVGVGRAYQPGDVVYSYCQTTMRAMITGFATSAILGLPTRFYDGAMVEWNSLNNVVNSSGTAPLPWDSPWRTDRPSVSAFQYHSNPTDPSATRAVAVPNIIDPYATTAHGVIIEDLAYKGIYVETGAPAASTAEAPSSSGGGGSPLPVNPCGG